MMDFAGEKKEWRCEGKDMCAAYLGNSSFSSRMKSEWDFLLSTSYTSFWCKFHKKIFKSFYALRLFQFFFIKHKMRNGNCFYSWEMCEGKNYEYWTCITLLLAVHCMVRQRWGIIAALLKISAACCAHIYSFFYLAYLFLFVLFY